MNFFRKKTPQESSFSRVASAVGDVTNGNRLVVNVVTSMACVLVADVLVQLVYDKVKARQENIAWSYNYWRSARLMAVVALLCGLSHKWYLALDQIYASGAAKDITAKIILDELIMAPLAITAYILALGLLEGKGIRTAYEEWKQTFTGIYQADVFVWPGVQIVNFAVIPVPHRLFYINLCSLVWHIYLSYAKHTTTNIRQHIPVRLHYYGSAGTSASPVPWLGHTARRDSPWPRHQLSSKAARHQDASPDTARRSNTSIHGIYYNRDRSSPSGTSVH